MADTEKVDPAVRLRQSIRWLPADMDTPISLYMKLVGNGEGILLESAEVDGRWGRYSILACDMGFYVSCDSGRLALKIMDTRFSALARHQGSPFVQGLRDLMADLEISAPDGNSGLPPITRALYGYFGFSIASTFTPCLEKTMPLEESECMLALPSTVIVFDHLYNRLCQISLGEHQPLERHAISGQAGRNANFMRSAGDIKATPDGEGYKRFVREIREKLRNGEAIQVVPSVNFSMPFNGDPFILYRRLRRLNASPYMFYMKFPGITLFGSSPEVMVSCSADNLNLSPIAGTRPRGRNEAEDAALAKELLADPKDRAEHVMLVDLGRNDLGRIARPGSVNVAKFMEVEKFSHVMHMTSSVTARIDDREGSARDALDVLAATFPAGTVSGAPKIRAMEIIRELEGVSRGPYAGCIGWIGLDKDSVNMDMGITIRSMWVKDGTLYWQAGGGIVHDSDPEMEWKEVCNKSAIMRLALLPEDENYVPADR